MCNNVVIRSELTSEGYWPQLTTIVEVAEFLNITPIEVDPDYGDDSDLNVCLCGIDVITLFRNHYYIVEDNPDLDPFNYSAWKYCQNCWGWTRYENDNKHCSVCNDAGRTEIPQKTS